MFQNIPSPEEFKRASKSIDGHVENNEERKEGVDFLLEKMNLLMLFDSELQKENLSLEMKLHISKIINNIKILNNKLQNNYCDKIKFHANSHFCDRLGHFITGTWGLVKRIERGKKKNILNCEKELEEYGNYFMICVHDDNYFKEELESKKGFIGN